MAWQHNRLRFSTSTLYPDGISVSWQQIDKGTYRGIGYLLENLVYLDLIRNGYDVYVGTLRNKEVDFVASKNDRTIYIQAAYILVDEETVRREYTPLESIPDNYEKIVVSLDDFQYPSHLGIRHLRAWELNGIL